MATLQIQSTLLDDVYPHRAVSADGEFTVIENSSGLPTLFTLGTNGQVYRVRPQQDSETGWALDDLECPAAVHTISAIRDPQGNIIVCGADQKAAKVYSLVMARDGTPGSWHVIEPAASITGGLTFYDLRLRINSSGAAEFFLLYFQRMNDPAWHYTYRIGRGLTSAASWSIGFNIDHLQYTGPKPVLHPCMALGQTNQLPTLSLYWHEAQTIRSWQGLDGTPVVSNITVPSGSFLHDLLPLGPGPDTTLYAAGSMGGANASGLYRYNALLAQFELVAGAGIQTASGVYSPQSGYDFLCAGPTGELFHLHGSPDAMAWSPFSPMGDRVVGVHGCVTEAAGTVFISSTLDKTLRHYYRSPESVDWEVDEVDVPARTAEQVVWYTTKVSVLDADARALNGVPVIVSCSETTEILVNGRPDLVGPGRSVILETSAVGNLVIQQSTAELANLYVPLLRLSLNTGESATLSPHESVRQQLYQLTGDELKAAKDRGGQPVLPVDEQGHADEIALQLATGAALGLAPPHRANLVSWASLGSPSPGRVRFTPAGSSATVELDIDVSDLFEGIKESVFGAITAVVTAVGETVVTGLNLAITTASGVYQVFVNTMEHAFDVIRSVLESAGAVFDSVLEWLGKLFDWEAIKAVAAEVATMLRSGMNSIPQMLTRANLPAGIDPLFHQLREQATSALDYIRQQAGGSSLGQESREAGFTNSDAIYTFKGTSYSNQANWLMDRLTPHMGAAIATIGLSNPAWAGFDTVFTSLSDAFLQTGESVANNFIALFENLVTSGDVLGTTINAIFDQMEAMVNGLLSALQGIVSGMVSAFQAVASSNALAELFDTPISIPVISDILAAVGLGSLTLMDLLSYLVAIPMHVVTTIAGGPVSAAELAATPAGVFLAVGIMFFVIMVFTAINDLLPEGKVLLAVLPSIVWVAAAALVFFGVAKSDVPPPELILATVLYLGYQLVGLRVNALFFGQASATRKFAIYSIVDAVVMNVLAAVWAIRTSLDPNPDNRPKPWQIAANHVGTLPDIFRWVDLVWSPPTPRPLPVRLMMGGVDVVGMGALTAGAIADYVVALNPTSEPRHAGTAPGA